MLIMTILLLLVAAFVVWHFIPERRSNQADPRLRRDARVSEHSPEWRRAIEDHCESPAESAFLEAMIKAFALQPREGSLRGSNLKLDLQVGQGRYRVDFLVNDWLVVEIDGAAYHSAPDQQKRDAVRDAYFTELGYAVVRIAAKTVFQRPAEAVATVSLRLAGGKPQISVPEKTSGLQRLAQTVSGIGETLGTINQTIDRERAIISALKDATGALAAEKHAIKFAIERAEREMAIETYCDTPAKREAFKQHQNRFKAALNINSDSTGEQPYRISIPIMTWPTLHENPEINKVIWIRYQSLVADRKAMLAEASLKLDKTPEMRPRVISALMDIGGVLLASSMASSLHRRD